MKTAIVGDAGRPWGAADADHPNEPERQKMKTFKIVEGDVSWRQWRALLGLKPKAYVGYLDPPIAGGFWDSVSRSWGVTFKPCHINELARRLNRGGCPKMMCREGVPRSVVRSAQARARALKRAS